MDDEFNIGALGYSPCPGLAQARIPIYAALTIVKAGSKRPAGRWIATVVPWPSALRSVNRP